MSLRFASHPLSRRRLLLGLAASGFGLASQPAAAVRYQGESFADHIELGGVPLQLNGVGMRAVLVLKGYIAALYLSEKSHEVDRVLAMPGPKRVLIRMLVDVKTEEFVKAINTSMGRNCSEVERQAVAERIAKLNDNLREIGSVKRNDLITLDFVPKQGLIVSLNGKVRGEPLPGADLYSAVLKMFLGEKPVDKRLKAGMLGLPEA